MTLFDIIRNLQAIAAQEPSVRSVSDGDIYDALNAAVDIKYGVFHITQDTHTTNGDLDVWGLNLFFIDRLLDNGENRLSIQSAGITILENVLKRFADTFGAEYMNNIVYTPFTQRFKDNCAGVFCKISVSTVMDNLCAEGGKIVLVKNQDKSIDITSNGRYNVTPDYGFSGLGSVDINVDVQGGEPLPPIEPVLQEKSIDITENGNYSVSPDAGVDGLNRVDITVNVPPVPITPNLQSKTIDITENGTTIITPAEEYDGLSQVEVITNVLTPLQSKTIDITENGSYGVNPDIDAGFVGLAGVGINVNVPSTSEPKLQSKKYDITEDGTYTVLPDEGYDGLERVDIFAFTGSHCDSEETYRTYTRNGTYEITPSNPDYFIRKANVTVNVPSTPYVVPDNMSFAHSEFTAFPFDDFDFSQKTNFYSCWRSCISLKEFPLINVSNGTYFGLAWYDCQSLTEFPLLDVSKGTNFVNAWADCYKLTSFPMLDLSNGWEFDCAWQNCKALTEFPALNLSRGMSFNNAWNGCSALTTMAQLDLSKAGHEGFLNTWKGCSSLTNLGGFGAIKQSFSLSNSPKLTVESMMNVITQAATIDAGTMNFGSTNLNKLTDEQKAVATNKGWTLS